MTKILHVRKISIDVMPNGIPHIELLIELRVLSAEGDVISINSDYGYISRKITDMNPIGLGTIADDGLVDNFELMSLVGRAALEWVAIDYDGTFDSQGRVTIQ